MIDFVKEYWQVILGSLTGVVWLNRVGQRGKNNERRIKALEDSGCVAMSYCEHERQQCKAHFASEFAHGQREFDEIKRRMDKSDRIREEQHKMIMSELLSRDK